MIILFSSQVGINNFFHLIHIRFLGSLLNGAKYGSLLIKLNVKSNSRQNSIKTQLCADDFGREKDDDYGARSFLHKYTLEFQDLCTVGIVVKAITLLEFEIRITPNYWKTKRPPHYLLT